MPSRRPILRRLLALLLALALLPGWAELVENVEHLLHDGHLAHSEVHELAQASEDAHETTDEHGCTPVSHHCGCHMSVPGVLADSDLTIGAPPMSMDRLALALEGRLLERAQAPPTPPPNA